MAAVRRECLVGLLIVGRNHLDRVFARLAMAWTRRNCEKQGTIDRGGPQRRQRRDVELDRERSSIACYAMPCSLSRPTRRSVVDPPVDEADPD